MLQMALYFSGKKDLAWTIENEWSDSLIKPISHV